jgi:hypothetical protein
MAITLDYVARLQDVARGGSNLCSFYYLIFIGGSWSGLYGAPILESAISGIKLCRVSEASLTAHGLSQKQVSRLKHPALEAYYAKYNLCLPLLKKKGWGG